MEASWLRSAAPQSAGNHHLNADRIGIWYRNAGNQLDPYFCGEGRHA
jgi:hypothetical protein